MPETGLTSAPSSRARPAGRGGRRLKPVAALLAAAALGLAAPPRAGGHEIYTGLHDKTGQLCCGGSDCAATVFREQGGAYEFLTREQRWVAIPQPRITFLPIPGDSDTRDHLAHLCYRAANDFDRADDNRRQSVFGDIFLYCAFIPPGGA